MAMDSLAPITAHLENVRWQLRVKRAMDVVGGLMLLLLLSPVLVVSAMSICLESPGPPLLLQERWGLGGRIFRCLKFRSMNVNAAQPGIVGMPPGHLVKKRDDPRITRVGRLIRRTSIDELPQLWNVVRGDMSLVGPRPLVLHMLEPYPEILAVRSLARPGITGLWQVSDRANNAHVFRMLRYDLEYLRTITMWTDIMILVRTVRVAMSGCGAV